MLIFLTYQKKSIFTNKKAEVHKSIRNIWFYLTFENIMLVSSLLNPLWTSLKELLHWNNFIIGLFSFQQQQQQQQQLQQQQNKKHNEKGN